MGAVRVVKKTSTTLGVPGFKGNERNDEKSTWASGRMQPRTRRGVEGGKKEAYGRPGINSPKF